MPGGTITETRSQVLNVVGYSGRRDAPFHVGLVGSGQVLNVGRPAPGNDLTLRITNTLAPNPRLPGALAPRAGRAGDRPGHPHRGVRGPGARRGARCHALGAGAGELNAVAVDPPPRVDPRGRGRGQRARVDLRRQPGAQRRGVPGDPSAGDRLLAPGGDRGRCGCAGWGSRGTGTGTRGCGWPSRRSTSSAPGTWGWGRLSRWASWCGFPEQGGVGGSPRG